MVCCKACQVYESQFISCTGRATAVGCGCCYNNFCVEHSQPNLGGCWQTNCEPEQEQWRR
jgi:hypothetical protein